MSGSVSPGRGRPGAALKAAVGVGALALVAAACGSSGQPPAAAGQSKSPMPEMSSSMPMASPSMSMGGGMLPAGARHMRVAVVSPAAGSKVTGNSGAVGGGGGGHTDTLPLAGQHRMGIGGRATRPHHE